nr:MAG TPA: hypothetical protein [Caudoviricetes sp.]
MRSGMVLTSRTMVSTPSVSVVVMKSLSLRNWRTLARKAGFFRISSSCSPSRSASASCCASASMSSCGSLIPAMLFVSFRLEIMLCCPRAEYINEGIVECIIIFSVSTFQFMSPLAVSTFTSVHTCVFNELFYGWGILIHFCHTVCLLSVKKRGIEELISVSHINYQGKDFISSKPQNLAIYEP